MNNLDEILAALPDAGAVNELTKLLRNADEESTYTIIESLLRDNRAKIRRSGLEVLKKVIKNKNFIFDSLNIGLKRKDVQEISVWLESVSSVVGQRAVIEHLNNYYDSHSEEVLLAIYKLIIIIDRKNPRIKKSFDQLYKKIDSENNKLSAEDLNYWKQIKERVINIS